MCEPGFIKNGVSCYKSSGTETTVAVDAEDRCRAENANLMSVADVSENVLARGLAV